MKTYSRRLLVILLSVLPIAVKAQFDFTANTDNTVTITGYFGPNGAVVIPTNLTILVFSTNGTFLTNNCLVTAIGNDAFSGRIVTSVTIPGSVTSIGDSAFEGCYSLTNVTIPDSVTTIGPAAFCSCPRLGSVTIPDSVTTIGPATFLACPRLGSVTIPGNVTTIGDEAFEGCYALTNVTIPANLTSIGVHAFFQCYGLTNVTIPSGVTNVGDWAFLSCYKLSAITVDAQNAFYSSVDGVLFDVGQTTLIQYPPAKTGGIYTIPSSVTCIGDSAFSDCTNLTSVTAPPNVTNIEEGAFYDCTRLTSITFSGGVTNIGWIAFYNCKNLKSVYFEGNAPSVGNPYMLFYGDNNATVYYVPGAADWSTNFYGQPAVLWNPLIQTANGSFGLANGPFGFNILGTADIPIMVEACTNLAGGSWASLQTCTLTNGSIYFTDPQRTNYPSRFYRLRSP